MQNSTRSIVILVVVVVVIAAVVFLVLQQGGQLSQRVERGPASVETPQGVKSAPGASPVASSGQVVTPEGSPVRLDVAPGTPEAPQQSNPIAPESAPPRAVKLTVTRSGWSLSEFTVKAGEKVDLVITAGDDYSHIFAFDDPSLEALAIGVGPGDSTRLKSFNAPRAGTYPFHCGVPGHAGERGVMIVK